MFTGAETVAQSFRSTNATIVLRRICSLDTSDILCTTCSLYEIQNKYANGFRALSFLLILTVRMQLAIVLVYSQNDALKLTHSLQNAVN